MKDYLTRNEMIHQLVDQVLSDASRREVDAFMLFLEGMAYHKEDAEGKEVYSPSESFLRAEKK